MFKSIQFLLFFFFFFFGSHCRKVHSYYLLKYIGIHDVEHRFLFIFVNGNISLFNCYDFQIAAVVNEALDTYFPPDDSVRIIAEPGRYMVASAFTLAVNIIAKRSIVPDTADADGSTQASSHMYYVNDGVYGSFNCIMYDHAHPEPRVISVSCHWLCHSTVSYITKLLLTHGLGRFVSGYV